MKESRMTPRTLALVVTTALIAGCSSPPKPPTVDDSKKRPVNVSQAVDLQSCRAELTAAKIVLTETLTTEQRRQVLTQAATENAISVLAWPTIGMSIEPNQIFVVNFPLGSADFAIAPGQSTQLIEQARNAKYIVIRGRTDASSDSPLETKLARRRAEAAFKYLVEMVRLPPEGIRLSWQGAGDLIGSTPADRQASRRVEIELYQAKPEFQWVTSSRELSPQASVASTL